MSIFPVEIVAIRRRASLPRPDELRGRDLHRRRARPPRPAFHEPRPRRSSRSSNLPETVKGALFARYSRYPGTLRRLFLDEFADSLPEIAATYDDAEGERAAKLYETIFLGYGDDSVAQLGGAHIACEWVSNVLTKVLQRPRLGAYLEQSTRYIAYDAPMPGRRLPLPPRPGARRRSTSRRWTRSSGSTPTRCRA